jgi:aminoglycoside/choline kinase family phosphotransferase
MESTQELKLREREKAERQIALEKWVAAFYQAQALSLRAMPGDASGRRYFRVYLGTTTGCSEMTGGLSHHEQQTYVLMDAPPPQEDCYPFAAIASALRQMGLQTPKIIHADYERGFLMLSDFGDATYLRTLTLTTLTPQNAAPYYLRALEALAVLQTCRSVEGYKIPLFTADFMRKEWLWHKEWVLDQFLGLSTPLAEKEIDACYELLIESAVSQPQVFMHRDYHSANLMVLPQDKVGILDFQDAFIGPLTYDVVSLLRDCYIDWPQEYVQTWALAYLYKLQARGELMQVKEDEFLRWFDLMGVQRHLKALMTFARKHVRDHQSRYLNYIPRTLNYLLSVSQHYPELAVLHDYLQITVKPAFERVLRAGITEKNS